ncbi:GTP-binding protein YPTC1 [Pelomyxa schiedti]|nr:GTP-binding protein YPTC1 [Pelomyxa schiedti]
MTTTTVSTTTTSSSARSSEGEDPAEEVVRLRAELAAAKTALTLQRKDALSVVNLILSTFPARTHSPFQSGRTGLKQCTTKAGFQDFLFHPPFPADTPIPSVAVWVLRGSPSPTVPPTFTSTTLPPIAEKFPPSRYEVTRTSLRLKLKQNEGAATVYWFAYVKPFSRPAFDLLISKIMAAPPSDSDSTPSNKQLLAAINDALSRGELSLNEADSGGQTMLHAASYAGNLFLAKWLVSHGANLNMPDSMGSTPLLVSIFCGQLVVANYLLSCGADASAVQTDTGNSAVYLMCRIKDIMDEALYRGVFQQLVMGNEDSAAECNFSGFYPLTTAILAKNIVAVNELLSINSVQSTLNSINVKGLGILIWALSNGCSSEIAGALLKAGADPNVAGPDGQTVLELATSLKYPPAMLDALSIHILRIPVEVVVYILSLLPPQDLFRLQRVCKNLCHISRTVIASDEYWITHRLEKSQFLSCKAMEYRLITVRKEIEAARAVPSIPVSDPSGRDYHKLLKVVLIGDSSVGKSSIITRFADDIFTETYVYTIGIDFKIKTVEMYGERIKLQIWDTHEERFRHHNSSAYYRGANAIIVVYDVTKRDTYEHMRTWDTEIERYGREDVNVFYVGTKSDLTAKREVAYEEAAATLNRVDPIQKPFGKREYLEVSSKTGANIDLLFYRVAQVLWLKVKAETDVNVNKAPTKPTAPPPSNCSVM